VRSLGLTAVQARLLLSLERQGGQNQAHYAELLEVEPITLTRIIDRMEEDGFITPPNHIGRREVLRDQHGEPL